MKPPLRPRTTKNAASGKKRIAVHEATAGRGRAAIRAGFCREPDKADADGVHAVHNAPVITLSGFSAPCYGLRKSMTFCSNVADPLYGMISSSS